MGQMKRLRAEMLDQMKESDYNPAAEEYYARLKERPSKRDRCIDHLRTTYPNSAEAVDAYISLDPRESFWFGFKTMADVGKDFEAFRKDFNLGAKHGENE